MAALLEGLLPRLLPDEIEYRLIPHEGKAHLDKSIPRKLKAWQDPAAVFVVLRDQDSADCRTLKAQIVASCRQAARRDVLVRIACREVESWYLADLAAVDRVHQTRVAGRQNEKKFRSPDGLGSPSRELAKLVPAFGKVASARALGRELALNNGRSSSFRHFIDGVRRLLPTGAPTADGGGEDVEG